MYREYFGFARMPFDNTADPQFFFKTAEHEEALAALLYGVTQRRGLVMVTGKPGTGKTLMGCMLSASMTSEADIATISHVPENPHDLIAMLCREYGLRIRNSHSTGELIERLRDFVNERFNEGRSVVAIVDEAQNLTTEMLEHLRMLSNMERDTAKLLQIVLLAQPELIDNLNKPYLEQFRQRVFCSCMLKPLERDQVRNYIWHRLRVAGISDTQADESDQDNEVKPLFDDQAIELIFEKSQGLPRIINQIADNALLTAYSLGHKSVDRQIVMQSMEEMMLMKPAEQHQENAYDELNNPPMEHKAMAASSFNELMPQHSGISIEILKQNLNEAQKIIARISKTKAATQKVAKAIFKRTRQINRGMKDKFHEIDQRVHDLERLQDKTCSTSKEVKSDLTALIDQAREIINDLNNCHRSVAGQVAEEVQRIKVLTEEAKTVAQSTSNESKAAAEVSATISDEIAQAREIINEAVGQNESLQTILQEAENVISNLMESQRRAERQMTDSAITFDQAAELEQNLKDHIKNAKAAAFSIQQLGQQMDYAEASCTTRMQELSGKFDQATQISIEISNAIKQADRLCNDLDQKLDAANQFKREMQHFLETLTNERALAEAAIEQLLHLRKDEDIEGTTDHNQMYTLEYNIDSLK